jgi:hypothetical protein
MFGLHRKVLPALGPPTHTSSDVPDTQCGAHPPRAKELDLTTKTAKPESEKRNENPLPRTLAPCYE